MCCTFPFQYDQQECLTRCITALAGSTGLWPQIASILLDKVLEFNRLITTISVGQAAQRPEFFDRTYFLLLCTEKVLCMLPREISTEQCFKLSNTQKALDCITVSFQDSHPLFSFYVRKLAVLLGNYLRQEATRVAGTPPHKNKLTNFEF